MKLAILGATGQTGKQAVEQALEVGHQVTAIVRSPDKIKTTHDHLKIVTADIFNSEELKEHFAGQDAIISCLGFKPEKPKTTGYLEATQAIVSAMIPSSRLVMCHSWYTEEESRGQAMFLIRWILIPMIRTVLDNMRRTEEWLLEQDGLDYTVVRPAGLTNGPKTEADIQECVGFFVPGASSRISRADVARFMLASIENSEHHAKQLSIAV